MQNAFRCHIENKMRGEALGSFASNAGGAQMTTIQAIFFGLMLALTPSLVVLAFLIWREDIGLREVDLDLRNQPPYPRT